MGAPSKLRREGREAFYPGGPAEMTCPYAIGHRNRGDWLDGWQEAARDYVAGASEREHVARVDQRLEQATARLCFALSSREAADAVKEMIATMLETK